MMSTSEITKRQLLRAAKKVNGMKIRDRNCTSLGLLLGFSRQAAHSRIARLKKKGEWPHDWPYESMSEPINDLAKKSLLRWKPARTSELSPKQQFQRHLAKKAGVHLVVVQRATTELKMPGQKTERHPYLEKLKEAAKKIEENPRKYERNARVLASVAKMSRTSTFNHLKRYRKLGAWPFGWPRSYDEREDVKARKRTLKKLMASGLSIGESAKHLCISITTAEGYLD